MLISVSIGSIEYDGTSKIKELAHVTVGEMCVSCDEDVLGLNVRMNNFILVQVCKSTGDISQDV